MLLIIFVHLETIFILCIDFDKKCDKFWMYHYRKSWRTRFGRSKWTYFKNYMDDYLICWNNK